MKADKSGSSYTTHVLVSPLQWGLGHASRMIPVVQNLLDLGCRVTVVASGGPMILLKNEFASSIEYIEYKGLSITYSPGRSQTIKLGMQIPLILYNIIKERRFARAMARRLKPDIIISDNCYGMRTRRVLSVFVTHQLQIHLPRGMGWMEKLINRINRRLIRAFDHCLIPDYKQFPGLAGSLSHTASISDVKYIDPLSRFSALSQQLLEKPFEDLPDDFILVMLSGPEPQRSILEKLLSKALTERTCVWLRGIPGNKEPRKSGNHWILDHADTVAMSWCIKNSSMVICRSGYSSIMDLAVFGKKCVFIPTPGQTEQEFLAEHLEKMNYVTFLEQQNLEKLNQHISLALSKKGLHTTSQSQQLKNTLQELISEVAQKQGSNS